MHRHPRRASTRSGVRSILIGASMGGMTGILAADEAGPEKVTKLVLVDVVPRYEKDGSARIRDFMASGLHGFESLEDAAEAVAAYLPHRKKPRSPEGLKKNLRFRDGRWFWHWDPAFLTKPARRFVRPRREARAGRHRLEDSDSADPRQAFRRGQRGGREALPRYGAPRRVRQSCPTPGTPPQATTTMRSVKSWSSSSTGEPLRAAPSASTSSKSLSCPALR